MSEIDSEFLQCADDPSQVSESWHTCNDGVQLRLVEFRPSDGNTSPKQPTIVFVAGWLSLVDGWIDVLRVLTPHYPVWYLESREKFSSQLPGPCANHAFSVEAMADDLKSLIETRFADGSPYFLVGSSLGATTILHALSEGLNPTPKASALIAPNAVFHFPSWAHWLIPLLPLWIYPAFAKFIKWYLRNFRIDVEKEPEQLRKYERTLDLADADKLKRNALTLLNYQLWDRLAKISGKTLIIGGEADTLHGIEDLERVTGLLTDARLEKLGSNKETHSEKAGLLIRDWLKAVNGGASQA